MISRDKARLPENGIVDFHAGGMAIAASGRIKELCPCLNLRKLRLGHIKQSNFS